jgi:glutathione transport system permease protein
MSTPPAETLPAVAEQPVAAIAASSRVRTPWTEFWRKFRMQHVAMGAGVFVLLLVVIAIVAPWIVPYDAENFFDYDKLNTGPSAAHWFGVDPLGRDIFSRILMGARISLATGFLSVVVGAIIGTVLGLLAGYYGGWWDRIVMRISDVLFAFPGILLALGVVAILGSSMTNVVVAVSVFSVPAFARLVRGTSIITAASLSVLGMGAQPPMPEWGAMLNEARADMVNAPHVALFPSLAIFFTVLAFNLLGDGLRDALDPKIDRV